MPTKDPEKLKLKRQRYRNKHRVKINERRRLWSKKNPEKERARKKRYIENNKDKVRAAERKRYLFNREKKILKSKEYFYKNKDKISARRKENLKSFLKKPSGMFEGMQKRIRGHGKFKTYLGKKILFTKKQFIDWILNNEDYIRLFKAWEGMDYEYVLTPTIDRINNNGDYSFDNIQVLTLLDNSTKQDL